jgi:hypothetical protein
LRQQAVLMRAASHSDLLELELNRRRIPFVKYGGIRYLEATHQPIWPADETGRAEPMPELAASVSVSIDELWR